MATGRKTNGQQAKSNIEIRHVGISELKPSEYNPRQANEKETKDLAESIRRFGMVDPLIVNSAPNRRNVVIGGHFRLKVARDMGIKTVPVVYISIPDIEREKELNLRLNRNQGEWNYDLLANFDENLLKDIGWDSTELDQIFQLDNESEERYKLVDRFIVPPFSILDTKQGYWQERKRQWLALGIKSELGRGGI